jgi:hypothetical protein
MTDCIIHVLFPTKGLYLGNRATNIEGLKFSNDLPIMRSQLQNPLAMSYWHKSLWHMATRPGLETHFRHTAPRSPLGTPLLGSGIDLCIRDESVCPESTHSYSYEKLLDMPMTPTIRSTKCNKSGTTAELTLFYVILNHDLAMTALQTNVVLVFRCDNSP